MICYWQPLISIRPLSSRFKKFFLNSVPKRQTPSHAPTEKKKTLQDCHFHAFPQANEIVAKLLPGT